MFALGLLMLAVLVGGGIEMADLFSERAKLRNVADSTALWGAASIALTGEKGVQERAKAHAEGEIAQTPLRMTATVTTELVKLGSDPNDQRTGLKVTIHGNRASFFGSLFPPGGFNVAVSSTALSVGMVPLCILASGGTTAALKASVELANTAKIKAADCLIQANTDVTVATTGLIEAGLVQAAGSASGPIDPGASWP